jgi:hypothetical protein
MFQFHKQRGESEPHDSSGTENTVVVMGGASSSKTRSQLLSRWAKPITVIVFVLSGGIALGLSFASTPTVTKIWATDADWDTGSLNNAVVSNNTVSLATSTTVPTTTSPIGNSTTMTNLALHKPTTCSSLESTQYLCKYVDDGNVWTRWSSHWSDPQSIRIDLGQVYNINEVKINWENAYAKAFMLQVSNNAKTWTTIYSTTAGTGGVQDITGLSGSGRYIRMYGTKRGTVYGYSIWEMRVFGAPVTPSSTPSYVPSGSETLTYDATNAVQWTGITPVDNKPSGTSITYQYRTSTDNATWSNWADISKIAQAPQTRYIQIMAALSTTNPAVTPTLSQITLAYAQESAAPTVNLTASSDTVTSGQAATLDWTSDNASICTASGGWSGSETTSGSVSTGPLSQNATFNLACTGPGGTANGTVTVAVQAASIGGSSAYSCTHVWPSDNGRCTFPSDSSITSTTGTITSGPWVDQNVWSGDTSYKQTNYVASPESWYVVANANTNFGGVETYPNTGWGSEGPNGSEVTVDSESSITSSWNVTIPTDTTKVAGWAGYDLWFNNWADEVMIQPDITANSYYDCTPVATATFGGMPWHMCAFGSERVWKPGTDDQHLQNQPSGTIDVKAFLTYMENDMTTAQDKLPANSSWTGGSFGFEICDTEGTNQTFKVNSFSWHEQ